MLRLHELMRSLRHDHSLLDPPRPLRLLVATDLRQPTRTVVPGDPGPPIPIVPLRAPPFQILIDITLDDGGHATSVPCVGSQAKFFASSAGAVVPDVTRGRGTVRFSPRRR